MEAADRPERFLLIDTDMGAEDVLTLLRVLQEESFELIGLTTVQGQTSLAFSGPMASDIFAEAGLAIPVAQGYERNLSHEIPERGDYSMDANVPEGMKAEMEEGNAWDFIYECARETGSLDVLCLGPLTNVARALEYHPDLEEHLRGIYICGGRPGRGLQGNYGFYGDPLAAQRILESSVDVYLIGDEAAEQCEIFPETFHETERETDRLQRYSTRAVEILFATEEARYPQELLALYAYSVPEAFIFQELGLRMAFREEERGRLVFDDDAEKKTFYALKVNPRTFEEWIAGRDSE